MTIVWDGTAPGTETRIMGPGEPEPYDPLIDQHSLVRSGRTNSPEVAASARSYRLGEVEEIAVAAVVREALWALIARRDPEEMPIEALVDEAAMAAGKVMARCVEDRGTGWFAPDPLSRLSRLMATASDPHSTKGEVRAAVGEAAALLREQG